LGFRQKKSHLIKDGFFNRINGGSDETRTRDLRRDRATL
jgi:hypothetical protein